MSQSTKTSEIEDCDFKWGKKRGIGGKNKNVQFYESFTYNSKEYSLYDSVYIYVEGVTEPSIGKLVKIWEHLQQKKIKVLWFFRPDEIRNWLKEGTTLEKEILLASGDGPGLADVNNLEAVAGKCHVVCTSKDNRNPQPCAEELRIADYIFYRTFDVGNCTISDKIDDKIVGVDVRFLLNRKGGRGSRPVLKRCAVKKEGNGKAVPANVAMPVRLSVKPGLSPAAVKGKNDSEEKGSLKKIEPAENGPKVLKRQRSDLPKAVS